MIIYTANQIVTKKVVCLCYYVHLYETKEIKQVSFRKPGFMKRFEGIDRGVERLPGVTTDG
jgi:hypothetical protein